MEEQYATCRVSIAPMRAEPNDRSEIVSQLLFGEEVTVLEKTERWWRIKTSTDSYEGWIDFRQVALTVKQEASGFMAPLSVNNAVIAPDGSKYYLAPTSPLPGFSNGTCMIGEVQFKVEFEPVQVTGVDTKPDLKSLALFYQNAPYLWGGRTLFGIDCSGFVQAVFKMAGLQLPRDAAQQVEVGQTVDFLMEAQCGDVAFFDNAEGRITHVGLLLSNNEIIHSSAKVRIDPLDDQGIFNKELRQYSHQLRIIKRFI
ncbi:NlpC/P60 family protein [Pedobacter sp.]|uniref:C40 family peptidase n=1 Tax=Pedobacter sp. TaxID=1411316 RepID=UPI003D7FFAD9